MDEKPSEVKQNSPIYNLKKEPINKRILNKWKDLSIIILVDIINKEGQHTPCYPKQGRSVPIRP